MTVDVSMFPAGFVWGAATAAYQVEGAATEGGRGPSIWDTFSHTRGRIARGDTGDVACDHYHRWESDLELIKAINLRGYRLSVSWARLQPEGSGRLNPAGVEFYRRLLARLRELQVRPFVTLYHWDMPQALEDKGGWPQRDTAYWFAEYAGLVGAALGDLADDWITLNEPWCSAFLGYGSGAHAPGRTSLTDAIAASHHLNLAHGLGVQAIRAQRDVRVGVAHIVTDLLPASDKPEDHAAARRLDLNNNRLFLDPVLQGRYPLDVYELYPSLAEHILDGDETVIRADLDFLGVNHYHSMAVYADPSDAHLGAGTTATEPATTALRWSVTPEALQRVLHRITSEYPHIPLYVTENGAAFDDHVGHEGTVEDVERVEYLQRYLGAAGLAVRQGVDLRGYFVWSLLDNFEWAEGYGKRFGLIYVDYPTQRRIPKASAAWYRDLINAHLNQETEPCVR
jgi:beta-glucosidase